MNKFQIAFLALVGIIAASLHAKPVPVTLDGTDYLVNGVDEAEPRFTATVEGSTEVQYLPVEQRTCNLILPRIEWAEAGRAMAAGAGSTGGTGGSSY